MPQTPLQVPDWAKGLDVPLPDWAKGLDAKPIDANQAASKKTGPTNPLFRGGIVGDALRHVEDAAMEHPAATGAMAAGAAVAPFTGGLSLPLAAAVTGTTMAAGAGIGRGVRDITTGERTPQPEIAKEMLSEGAGGALSEVGGKAVTYALGKAAPVVSEWLYNLGLRPPRVIRQQFTGANAPAATALREHLLPNPEAVQSRLTEIEQQVSEAVAHADQPPNVRGLLGPGTRDVSIPLGEAPTGESSAMTSPQMPRPSMVDPRRLQGGGDVAMPFASAGTGPRPASGFGGPGILNRTEVLPASHAAGAPPTMIDPRQIAANAAKYAIENGKLADRGFRQSAMQQVKDLTDKYLAENAGPMTVDRALALKRAEQSLASASYLKIARGGDVNDIETLFHQGLANAARQSVIDKAPEVAPLLAREQGLIGLKNAAEFAQDRPEVLAKYMTGMSLLTGVGGSLSGHPVEGLAGAALLMAVQSPTLAGAMAIAGKRLTGALAPFTPQIMKAIVAAYIDQPTSAQMSSHGGAR